MKKTLHKSNDRMICGVCGGIAEYLGIDPTWVRLALAALCIFGGTGVLAYIVAAIIIPEPRPETAKEPVSAAE